MGDLSGRLGSLDISKPIINVGFSDYYFPPAILFNQPMKNFPNVRWNWILHLVCPAAKNPRLVCAVMKPGSRPF